MEAVQWTVMDEIGANQRSFEGRHIEPVTGEALTYKVGIVSMAFFEMQQKESNF